MTIAGDNGVGGQPPGGITLHQHFTGEPGGGDNQQQQQPPEGFIPVQDAERMMQEAMERVRKEEKDKLYPQLTQQEQDLAVLKQEREQRIAAEETARQQAEEAERQRQIDEASAKDLILKMQQDSDERFAQMQRERDTERALFSKEQELSALNQYKLSRITQERDFIAPQFDDLIRGNNQQEIDASIESAKAKTAEIVEAFQAANGGGQQQQQQFGGRTPPPPGALTPSGAPPIDMAGIAGGAGTQQTLTAEDLRNMPIEEYSRMRPQIMAAMSDKVNREGPYAP